MRLAETVADLRAIRKSWSNEIISFVPTMGALHQGHLSLIDTARSVSSKVVVSIYVNPLQFGPNEDFERYPRTKEADLALCEEYGTDLVFYPKMEELHPEGFETITHVVPPPYLVNQLCGLLRPGHFTGVATIVMKLFNLVQPEYAIFGQKDAQQLAIIQHMTKDLDIPLTIIPAPTARESDGLAMSSRNRYIATASDRQQARLLSRLLTTVQALYRQGMETRDEAISLAKDLVLDEALYPDFQLEYLDVVDSTTFKPVETLDDNSRILVAAKIGSVRLIDNALVSETLLCTKQRERTHFKTTPNTP